MIAFVLKITTIVAILRTIGIPIEETTHRFLIQPLPAPGAGVAIAAPGREILCTRTRTFNRNIGGFALP